MSTARERRERRKKRQAMAKQANRTVRQIVPEGTVELPQVNIPGLRWIIIIPAAIFLIGAVIIGLRMLSGDDAETAPNAIWLDSDWSHFERPDEAIGTLVNTLSEHEVGHLIVYTSSLKSDNTWSGLASGTNRFAEVEPTIQNLVRRLKAIYPSVQVYAWIEIATDAGSGYRLDSTQVHTTVANFANRMVDENSFDGVLIDAKPLFDENDDFPVMLRTIRAEIGIDTPLLVNVPPDLTPTDADITQPDFIAPGTEWSDAYKQRVALQADTIVIAAFNSYRESPIDYIEWVTYQVDTYVAALTAIDTSATVLVSVPNYESRLPAHDATVESFAAGLDGVTRGISILDEEVAPLVQGVAIYSETDLLEGDWLVYRQKWLNR